MKLILKSLLTTVSIGLIPHTVMASNMNTPPKLILQVTVHKELQANYFQTIYVKDG